MKTIGVVPYKKGTWIVVARGILDPKPYQMGAFHPTMNEAVEEAKRYRAITKDQWQGPSPDYRIVAFLRGEPIP